MDFIIWKIKIKKWKKERTQSNKKANVGTLALAFIAHGSKGFRVKVKGAKIKYKPITSKDYKNKLEMPQLDKFTFVPQVFWLVVIFFLLYYI